MLLDKIHPKVKFIVSLYNRLRFCDFATAYFKKIFPFFSAEDPSKRYYSDILFFAVKTYGQNQKKWYNRINR